MLEVSKIKANKLNVENALRKRGWGSEKMAMIDKVISADDARKRIQTENDGYLAQRNTLSKQIGQLFKEGKVDEANAAKAEVEMLKSKIAEAEQQAMNQEFIPPAVQIFKGLSNIHIKHQHAAVSSSVEGDTQTLEPLLTSSIPNLHAT